MSPSQDITSLPVFLLLLIYCCQAVTISPLPIPGTFLAYDNGEDNHPVGSYLNSGTGAWQRRKRSFIGVSYELPAPAQGKAIFLNANEAKQVRRAATQPNQFSPSIETHSSGHGHFGGSNDNIGREGRFVYYPNYIPEGVGGSPGGWNGGNDRRDNCFPGDGRNSWRSGGTDWGRRDSWGSGNSLGSGWASGSSGGSGGSGSNNNWGVGWGGGNSLGTGSNEGTGYSGGNRGWGDSSGNNGGVRGWSGGTGTGVNIGSGGWGGVGQTGGWDSGSDNWRNEGGTWNRGSNSGARPYGGNGNSGGTGYNFGGTVGFYGRGRRD